MANSQVCTFYSGKNFFITGGTGLVGLCLLERILRSFPDVGSVYLLMRPKRGKGVDERMEEIKKNPLFETLLETNTADIFKKVVPVAGELGEPNLGLSSTDRNILDDVNIIVHSAAALDYQLNLKASLKINANGTRRVMELACQLKGLKAMVHVSSAYVNHFLKGPQEILYDVPENVDGILTLVETMTEEELSLVEPTLLKTHRSFYSFTKHLAEHEVAKYSDKFPCTIVRPSLIHNTWKEPVPGWTSSRAGIIPFVIGVWLGLVRGFPDPGENIVDFIPVDVFANQVLVAGFHASQSKGLSIYHCTSSTEKPYRWKILMESMNRVPQLYPLKDALWYPHIKLFKSVLLLRISSIFIYFIPAIFLGLFLRITGGTPVFSKLVKTWKIFRKFEWFYFTEWKFCNDNIVKLSKQMNEIDRTLFYTEIADIDWKEYTTDLFLGCRKYLLREDDSNLVKAKFKQTVLLVMHVVWHMLMFSLLWYVVATLTGRIITQSAWCVPILYMLYRLI